MDIQEDDFNQEFAGKLLFNYVWWILFEAKKQNLHTLYFLARDGYLLYRIAQLFTSKFNLNIECRYLYSSRFVLRSSSFFLLDDEKYKLVLFPSNTMTVNSLLQRGNLNKKQHTDILMKLNCPNAFTDKILTKSEYYEWKDKILSCTQFWKYVDDNSKQEYKKTVAYLRQEKVLEQDTFSIVDSGWSGSMQRSFRQILEHEHYKGKITGFYFGMFTRSREVADGTFNTFFFDYYQDYYKKSIFSNNLFECILSVTHGMTIGFESLENKIVPVFAEYKNPNEAFILKLQNDVLSYTENKLKEISFASFCKKKIDKEVLSLVKDYMYKPSTEAALHFGRFLFSDDVSETYCKELASKNNIESVKQYSIFRRLTLKLLKRDEFYTNAFWQYGLIAYCSGFKRVWYRINFFLWQLLKYSSGK